MSDERNRYILAIDLGTSALKVALVTVDGEIAACQTEPMHVKLLPGGGAEQDPDDWWDCIVRTAKSLIQKSASLAGSVAGLCCTSHWSGTVAVDRDGRYLRPAIIWMDSRGARYVKRITGGPIEVAGYGITKLWAWVRLTAGAPGHAGKDPIAHILYIKHEHPEIYAKTYKFLEPKDYLNLRLTRRKWNLSGLHKPSAVHLCVTLRHTQPGVAGRFLDDLKAAVDYVKTHPDEKSGMAPLYGMAATIPLRGVVSDLLKRYIDLLYRV